MPAVNRLKNQPGKAKGLGGVFPLRSKNAALLYMYRYHAGAHLLKKKMQKKLLTICHSALLTNRYDIEWCLKQYT